MSLVKSLREYLKNNDGATINEFSEKFKVKKNTVYVALRRMPDVYIDRWTEAKQQSPSEAVWCTVTIPENCPKPDWKMK